MSAQPLPPDGELASAIRWTNAVLRDVIRAMREGVKERAS